MATLTVLKASEAPAKPRPFNERQAVYEDFILTVIPPKGDKRQVGELELDEGEVIRGEKVRLRRASTRMGVPLEIWDANGRIYFQRQQARS